MKIYPCALDQIKASRRSLRKQVDIISSKELDALRRNIYILLIIFYDGFDNDARSLYDINEIRDEFT